MNRQNQLKAVFDRLLACFGPLHWWPADSPFEVCLGAILTQNTAWTNVEKAIINLKQAGIVTPTALLAIADDRLAELIRPAGFFNVKTRRLKAFVTWLFERHGGSLDAMFSGELETLRNELLRVCGIGPETCDSILLYAGHKPTFVVDAYTRRLFSRLGIVSPEAGYDEVRDYFMARLEPDTALFNEYHALIVEQCKRFCRTRQRCEQCELRAICPAVQT